MNLQKLREKISNSFDLGELHDLCFDLEVEYENLGGSKRSEKSRELVEHCERHGQLTLLIERCQELRPSVNWQEVFETGTYQNKVTSNESKLNRNSITKFLFFSASRFPIWLKIIIGLAVFIAIYSGTVVYNRILSHVKVAPGFVPALIGFAESNSDSDHYFAQHPDIPQGLNWYVLNSTKLETMPAPLIKSSNIDKYLYLSSRLHTDSSWTAIFFWRTPPLIPLNALGKTDALIILNSEHEDTVEITFSDAHGNEKKIGLPVVQGWAGYIIPLSEFSTIDFNQLHLFEFAHARTVGSIDANTFKIAYIDLK